MTQTTPDRTRLVRTALRRLAWGFRSVESEGAPPLDPGMVARLRRGAGAATLDLWRVLYDRLGAQLAEDLLPDYRMDEAGRAWRLVLQGMALMAPDPHRDDRSVGEALARVGFSENRLIRLLRAEGEAFPDAFVGACRFLRAKGKAVDWAEFGHFALERSGAPGIPDSRRVEGIARDYVRATRADENVGKPTIATP